MLSRWWYWVVLGLAWPFAAALADEVALVTALSGAVRLQAATGQDTALQAFVKLQQGDRLRFNEQARVQLVLLHSGREEVWRGPGTLRVEREASTVLGGNMQPQVRQLPRLLVKQLAKTPAPDAQVRAGIVRLRGMPSGGTLASVEKNYADLRKQAGPADRNPELYLLASYFELQEYDKLKQLLTQLDEQTPGNAEVALLRSLYVRAMNNAKMAQEQ